MEQVSLTAAANLANILSSQQQQDQTTTESEHSHSRTSSEQQINTQAYTYGRDLWDCLSSLNESTTSRTFFMKALRSFFSSYKKSLDVFSQSLQKSVQQYEKDFVRFKHDHVLDSTSTAMLNVKMCLDEMVKSIQDSGELILKDMVEPLEIYYKHYGLTNNELLKQGNQFWNMLHQERTQMLFAKENYYNQAQQAHQIMNQLNEIINQQKQTSSNPMLQVTVISNRKASDDPLVQERRLQLQQAKADITKQEYEKCLNKLNYTIDNFESHYKPILNRIQEADEYQINYVKSHMDKFAKNVEGLGLSFKDRGEELLQSVAQISSETDLKIFIDLHKSTNPFLQKEEFQQFENKAEFVKDQLPPAREASIKRASRSFLNPPEAQYIDSSNNQGQKNNQTAHTPRAGRKRVSIFGGASEDNNSDYELLESDQIDRDRQKTFDLVVQLANGVTPITLEEKGQLIQLMQNKQMRLVLTDILNEINSPKPLQSYDCIKVLADILKFVLTLFVHEQVSDYRLLYTIIESSQNTFTYVNKRKLYLSTLLSDHDIWQDKKSWKDCILEIISMKMEDSNQRRKQRASTSNSDKDKGFFRKGLSSLKGILKSKQDDKVQELKSNQNLIFNELSRFVQSTINFGLPYDQANELLIIFCDQFQVEQSRIHLLLTELQSNQKKTSNMFTEKEQLIWSLQRRGNRLKAFGFSDKTQILGITIRYIDRDEDLRSILLLNKDIYELLKEEILEQALLRSSQDRLKKKRKTLWLRILKIDEGKANQEYWRNQEKSSKDIPKLVSDAIEVDVNRSFNSLKQITASNLNNILKTYAIVNPDLDYCQGMNFIAGFLYLVMGSESLAYAVMKEIIDKFSMGNLFNQELPMLKLNFYQLDRLISIVLSDLHTHFKDETINSSYYSSPYFITLFTSVLQMQETGDNCQVLQRFWDYFIISGQKSIFKVSLAILKENEESLLQMPFEVMLTQIVFLPIKFFVQEFENEQQERAGIQKFDILMKNMKIPTMLLERLKNEFDENYKISALLEASSMQQNK